MFLEERMEQLACEAEVIRTEQEELIVQLTEFTLKMKQYNELKVHKNVRRKSSDVYCTTFPV